MEDIFEEITNTKKTKIKRIGLSIDEAVVEDFNKLAKARKWNKSKLIENFLKKLIEQEKSLIK